MIDEHEWRSVLQVAEDGTFSAAAKHLYISQPSLSQCIKKVETALGVRLFARSQTPLALPTAGALDERHVRVDAGERALEHLAAVAASAAGLCAAALAERRRRHFPRARARRGGVAGDYIGVHHLFHIDSVYHTHFWFDKRLRIEYYGKKQHGEGEI